MKKYTGTRIVIGVAQIFGWLVASLALLALVMSRESALIPTFLGCLGVAMFIQAFSGVGLAIIDLVEHTLHTSASKMPISKQEQVASHRKIAPTVEAASRPHVPELRPSAAELLEPEEPRRRMLDHTDLARLEREAAERGRK